MTTIYHNPRCSKSRQTLALLEENGVKPTIIEYLKEGVSQKEMVGLLKKLGLQAQDLIRTGEEIYKTLGLKGKNLTEGEWIAIIVENPKLLQRPIVVKDDQAIVGRPPENVLQLL